MPLDVDAICFDLDDTLCVYERTVEDLLALSFERAAVEPFFDGPTYRTYFDRFLEDFDDADALRTHCFEAIAADQGRDPALGREVAREYAAARDQSNVQPRSGVPEVVRRLGERYPIALVTNGDASMQGAKLEGVGLSDAFDVTVFAGEDAAPKPSAEPFEHALVELGVRADRTVHVGNSLESDVAGATAAGLQSVWTPAEHDLPADVQAAERLDPDHPEIEPRPDVVLSGVDALADELGIEH
ncbi:haloacid dehalogenase superfamily enzyme, subfamily IA [Salinarchaeum sp. Harcht-Bsk1]|uniref:HAD family hydrolase n=1 Tax=Salinarchaeum sp. Harcht-Bsk1 TaxID=1333523 RepID=UPI0003424380|nr:HAD family hydrolase [Salinarchaeum sp. Harcht-Bsk1]AGN00484.1 haloacid dehalogenase superfamily enzyme, subfamily IA [Salinarchaeum sp. Harcht-Bsk1]